MIVKDRVKDKGPAPENAVLRYESLVGNLIHNRHESELQS
jgi:hypothetical protein